MPREGLVELCYEGEYRSICLENVSPPDAALVCEALGFLGGKYNIQLLCCLLTTLPAKPQAACG